MRRLGTDGPPFRSTSPPTNPSFLRDHADKSSLHRACVFLFLCQPYISYNSSSLLVLDLVYDSAPSCHTTGTHNGPRALAPSLLGTIRRLPTDLVCLPTTRDVRPALLLTLPRQARVRQYRVRNRLPSGTSLRVRTTALGTSLSQPSPRPANSPCRKRGIQNAGRPTGNTG